MLNLKTSLRHEFYKFYHQKIIIYAMIALLGLMVYSTTARQSPESMLTLAFGAGQWITLIMITVSSTFLAMEYENGTIVLLLSKMDNKFEIYISKILVLLSYAAILIVISIIFTFILKMLLFCHQCSWFETIGQKNLLQLLSLNILGSIIYILFIVSFTFLLLSLLKVNSAVIGIGLAAAFFGAYISGALISISDWVKVTAWNPLNMINIVRQLSDGSVIKITKLTDTQLFFGNLGYTAVFIIVGYVLFKKRRV